MQGLQGLQGLRGFIQLVRSGKNTIRNKNACRERLTQTPHTLHTLQGVRL
jgi:hypothetical protein